MTTPEEFAQHIMSGPHMTLTEVVRYRDAQHATERERLEAESRHWCDQATKLASDCQAADERAALAVNRATRLETRIQALREGLDGIADYDTDFAKGPADNVNVLQAIAERALAADDAARKG
jgi:chromosome segregation ATPase